MTSSASAMVSMPWFPGWSKDSNGNPVMTGLGTVPTGR